MITSAPMSLVGVHHVGDNLEVTVPVAAPIAEWKKLQVLQQHHGGSTTTTGVLAAAHGVRYHADGSNSSTAASENSEKRKRKLDVQTTEEDTTKPYECRFCPMKFAKSQALGGHMNRHRQEREREQYMHARQLVMQQQPAFSSWTFPAHNSPGAAMPTPAGLNRFTQFTQQRESSPAGLNLRYSSAVSTPSVPAASASASFFMQSGAPGSNLPQSWQCLMAQAGAQSVTGGSLVPDNTRSSLQGSNGLIRDDQMLVPNFLQTRPSVGSYGASNSLPSLVTSRATSGNAFGSVGQDLAQGSSPYGLQEQRSPLDSNSLVQPNPFAGSAGQHIGGLSKQPTLSGQVSTAAASDINKRHGGHSLNLASLVGAAGASQLQGQFGFQPDQLPSLSQVPGTLQSDQVSSQFNLMQGGYGQFFPATSFGMPLGSQPDFLNQPYPCGSFEGLGPTYNMLQFSGSKSLSTTQMQQDSGAGNVADQGGSFNVGLGQVVQEQVLGNIDVSGESAGSLHSPHDQCRGADHHAAAGHAGSQGNNESIHHLAVGPDHLSATAQHPSCNSPINVQTSGHLQLDAAGAEQDPTLQENLSRYNQADPDSSANHHATNFGSNQQITQVKIEAQQPPGHPASSASTPPPPPISSENARPQ